MIDDLLDNYKLDGMDKSEIKELLGSPYPNNMYCNHAYYLGLDGSGLGVDNKYLCLGFDANEKVMSVRRTVFR